MKYKMERQEKKPQFIPFSVTITFESEQEWGYFHDKIATKLKAKTPNSFTGDIYRLGRGKEDSASGTISID